MAAPLSPSLIPDATPPPERAESRVGAHCEVSVTQCESGTKERHMYMH